MRRLAAALIGVAAVWGGAHALVRAQARPADLRFTIHMIDGGFTAA